MEQRKPYLGGLIAAVFVMLWCMTATAQFPSPTFSGLLMLGKANFAASTANAASINIPLGSPPTTPLVGDMWLTAGGLFIDLSTGVTQVATYGTFAAPPPTGNITPNTGAYTALAANSLVVGSPSGGNEGPGSINMTGCYINGAACTTGGVNASGSPTAGQIAEWTGPGAITGIGTSGSGNVALTNSPVFTTPNLGTPSTLVLTNATGTPAALGLANATGTPTSIGLANGTGLPYTGLPALAANQVLGALTATTPSGQSVPSCSATSDALGWQSGTGFTCFTGYAPLASPTFTGTTTVNGTVQGTAINKLMSYLDDLALIPGCVGDGVTDDTACVQAAMTAAQNGGAVYLGNHLYAVSSTITIDREKVIGTSNGRTAGGYAGIVMKSGFVGLTANMSVLSIGNASLVQGIAVYESGSPPTSGTMVTTGASSFDDILEDIVIGSACNGISLSGNTVTLNHAMIVGAVGTGCNGVIIGAATTGANSVDIRVMNSDIIASSGNPLDADMLVEDAGGLFLLNNDLLYATRGTVIKPGANQQILWLMAVNTVLGDTTANNALLIDTGASSAVIRGLQFTQDWSSNNQSQGTILEQNTGGGTINGIWFNGQRAFQGGVSAADNVHFSAGSDISFDNSHVCGNYSSGVATGIYFANGVTPVAVRGTEISPTCAGLSGAAMTTGITLGGSNLATITNNQISSAIGQPLNVGTPAAGTVVSGNEGIFTGTIYAEAFGVKCDGSFDNTAFLTSFFGAITPGTLAVLPAGTCLYKNAISIQTSNFTIRGGGPGLTFLTYDGSNTTNNIFTVGTTSSSCNQSHINVEDVEFDSNTVMTAGDGVRFNDICYLNLTHVDVGPNNTNLYNGIHFNGGGVQRYEGGNIQGSNIGEIINGDTSVSFTDMYQSKGAITGSTIGLDVAGNVGGFNMDMYDLVNNKTNLKIDQSVTAVKNAQVTLGGAGMAIDGTSGSPNIGLDLEDAGGSGSILEMTGTWVSTAANTCLKIGSGVGAYEVKVTGIRMENCTTYGIDDESTSAIVMIDGGIIAGNGTGINTVAGNQIRVAAWPNMKGNNANTTNYTNMTPTVTSCGSGCAINGASTDYWGDFATGSGAGGTTATINFVSSWSVTPNCILQQFAGTAGSPQANTTSVSAYSFTNLIASTFYSYSCVGLH